MKLKLPVSRFPRQFDPRVVEMMDRPDPDPLILTEDLIELQKLNRWFGAGALIRAELERFFSGWLAAPSPPSRPCAILDLCTGSADLPRLIVEWCRDRNIAVQITAADLNPLMLDQAAWESRDFPEIEFVRANVLQPPFVDRSFDWVICNLALHHFPTEQAVGILKQMWRITRTGMLVNDLSRGRALTGLVRLIIPLLTANPMTRFDAPLSTRRAFTRDEMLRLAFHAGIPNPASRRYFFARQTLSACHLQAKSDISSPRAA